MGRKNRPRAKTLYETKSRSKYAEKVAARRIAKMNPPDDEAPSDSDEEDYIRAEVTALRLRHGYLFLETSNGTRLHMMITTWYEKYPEGRQPVVGDVLMCTVEEDPRGPHVTKIV